MKPRDFCREPGYDKALLVTYEFDALFFERVVLPDLWVGGSTDVQVIADLGQVSQALPRWIGQVRQLGQRYQLTCANVRGAFHPKIIVRAGSAGAAVWIGSGNLTYGGWGCNLEVGTAWRVGQALADRGLWLRPILAAISSCLPKAADAGLYQKIIDAPWLIAAGDASAPPILITQPTRSIGQQLVERWQGRRFDRAMIVTGSSDDRGALLKWLHDQFGVSQATILLDPAMVSFDPAKLAGLPMQIGVVRPKDARTVHAKFYWLEGQDGCASAMGSANCSSAAWLISPENGGNIEAIAVYDRPSKDDFAEILARIDPSETEPANLVHSPAPEESCQQSGRPFPVAEVSWERLMSEVTVVFATPLPNAAAVAVVVSSERAVCQRHKNGYVWSATMAADPFRGRETIFGDVRITLADGQDLCPQQVWINDLAELRTSAKGRGIGEGIKNLGRWHPTSEHQKIVAELQRIGTALLTDNSLFPDPLFRNTKAEKENTKDDGPVETPPVDPEHLIRSIDIQSPATEHPHSAHGLNGITLTGVLRALFDFGDEGLETSATEEPGDLGGSDPPPGPNPTGKSPIPPPPPTPPLPPERARTKLRKDMDEFVRKLAEKEFAEKCTVTQLVQAVAYPLAVIANGIRGGWIAATTGQDWTSKVFDISFCAPYSVTSVGVLDAVRQRCEARGELQAFRAIVGDGTLWAAMLASVSKTAWTGVNSGIKKAFALRRVLLSQELLGSAETGRMSSLITNIERQSGLPSVLNPARDATTVLTELERYLVEHWDDLMKRRCPARRPMLPETLFFTRRAGGLWSWNRLRVATRRRFACTVRIGRARRRSSLAST